MQSIDLTLLAAWLAETDIDLLTLDAPMGHLRLRRGDASAATPAGAVTPALPADDSAVIAAPSVGVFLDAHPLRPAPVVLAGERVAEGQLVGLLQIGALLLPVRAPCAGTVGAPCVTPGTPVGYGTPLRHIRPHAAR